MLNMISPEQALATVLETVAPRPPVEIDVAAALGCILAEPIQADRDYPPFNRAMMDGYAVRLADAGRTMSVVGELGAGHAWDETLAGGQVLEIMTGAPCPEGCEAVVAREDVLTDGAGGELRVTLPVFIRPMQNIQLKGLEAQAGATVLWAGDRLTPLALAVLVSVGRESVLVHAPPRVAILTTGDELAQVGHADAALAPAMIRDSNGPMLEAMLRGLGVREVTRAHATDDPADLRAKIDAALGACDVLVMSGGVSAGKYDLVPSTLAEAGVEHLFHKVTQRPGKPLLFGKRERAAADGGRQLVFGLPGNPLSCQIGFHRYIAAAIRRLMNQPPDPPRGMGLLTEAVPIRGQRTVFQLALAEWTAAGWQITPLRGKGSADIFTAARANAMLKLDPGHEYPADAQIEFEWL